LSGTLKLMTCGGAKCIRGARGFCEVRVPVVDEGKASRLSLHVS